MNCPCAKPNGKAGYCEVRNRVMAAHHINLCRTDERYRNSFNGLVDEEAIGKRHGTGTQLKKLLGTPWILSISGRPCDRYQSTLNSWGPDKCAEKSDMIIGWMKKEAKHSDLPFVQSDATTLLAQAINNARTAETLRVSRVKKLKEQRELRKLEPRTPLAQATEVVEEKQVYDYNASTIVWTAAGCPIRSDDEVNAALAACRECKDFIAHGMSGGLCKRIGNYLNIYAGQGNKIRRATEHCPKGRW